jgi:hypothetical protein
MNVFETLRDARRVLGDTGPSSWISCPTRPPSIHFLIILVMRRRLIPCPCSLGSQGIGDSVISLVRLEARHGPNTRKRTHPIRLRHGRMKSPCREPGWTSFSSGKRHKRDAVALSIMVTFVSIVFLSFLSRLARFLRQCLTSLQYSNNGTSLPYSGALSRNNYIP